MKKSLIVTWLCFSVACLFAIAGVVLLLLMGTIIHDEIAASIPLQEGSVSYKNWIDPPVPVYMQFWLFNVTNGEAVQNDGARPALQQIGPFTYQEHRVKKNITFYPNGTISYLEVKSYNFIEEMSQGSEEDTVINLNIVLVGVSQMLGSNHPTINSLVSAYFETLDGKGLFVNHTVKEWLWGYEDSGVKEIEKILKHLNVTINLPFPKLIGLFAGKNGTDDGVYTIYSGSKNVSQFNVIDRWNGNKHLNFWTTKIANDINGTDGTMFPPFITKEDTLYIFSSDLCRSIDVIYEKDVTIKGIELMRFIPPPILFANHTVNPDNQGYCTPNCLGSGVLNVSVCQNGLPAVMSQPHFFQAASKYLNAVTGLHPSAELSQTRIDVDPHTGVVLNAAKKLQINIDVHPVDGFDQLSKVNLFMPILWINESAKVDDKSAAEFKKQVLGLINVAEALKYAIFGVGLLFLCVMIVVLIVVHRRNSHRSVDENDDTQNIINSENQEPQHV